MHMLAWSPSGIPTPALPPIVSIPYVACLGHTFTESRPTKASRPRDMERNGPWQLRRICGCYGVHVYVTTFHKCQVDPGTAT